MALAVLMIPLLVAIQIGPSLWPPNGLSQAQYAFCTRDYRRASERVFGGPDFIAAVAGDYVKPLPQYAPLRGFRDPQWAAACRYLFVLDGLSDDQSSWCAGQPNQAVLAQAVDMLGAEGDGPDPFSPPGDSPPEYVQACRLAYDYLRNASAVPIPPDIPAFALTASEARYCGELNADAINHVLARVGLARTSHPTPLEDAEKSAVGCRLAFIEANWDRGGTDAASVRQGASL